MPEFLTLAQAAELLQVSDKSMRRMVQRGDIRAFKVGPHFRFKRADLERALKPVRVYTPAAREAVDADA